MHPIHIYMYILVSRNTYIQIQFTFEDWLTYICSWLFFCQIGSVKKDEQHCHVLVKWYQHQKVTSQIELQKYTWYLLIIELGRTFIYFKIITKV